MSATAPSPRDRPGRYTAPSEAAEPTSNRPMIIRVVAALVILALVLAPIAFVFAF